MTTRSNIILIATATTALSLVAPARANDLLGPLVRTLHHQVSEKNQYEALGYCATRGGLPGIQEIALALNPQGVSYWPLDGFYPIMLQNHPSFFYTHTTYQRPALTGDDAIDYAFYWSSSLPFDISVEALVFGRSAGEGLTFDVITGLIEPASSQFDTGLVRCLNPATSE